MNKPTLLMILFLAGTIPAAGGESVSFKTVMTGVEQRAEKVLQQTKGHKSYDALMAQKLAWAALDEKQQNDLRAAWALMERAEEHAGKAGMAVGRN